MGQCQGPIDVLLFDLDGCLYPIENGYEAHVRDNIFDFMHQRLGVPRDQAEAVWRPLFKQTNQSLKGLRVGGYAFQTDEYWDFIRKDADKFLKPDPEVRACLQSLPQRKWLLTNCNEKHAGIALELLGLQDQFDGVLGANFMGDFCKPDPEAFEKVFKCIGAVPSRTAMFEDSLKNLVQAKKLGLATVLIAGKTALEEQGTTASALDQTKRPEAVDAVIRKPCESGLRQHLPQLWIS